MSEFKDSDSAAVPQPAQNHDGEPPVKSSGRWWKIPIGLIALLALLYVSFLVAFFHTPLGPTLINRRPDKFQMHWDSGSMWRFGLVKVEGLSMEGTTRRGTWQVDVDRAELKIDPRALLDRTLRVSDSTATSCRFTWTSHKRSERAADGSEAGSSGDQGAVAQDHDEDTSATTPKTPPIHEKPTHQKPTHQKPTHKKPKWRFVFEHIDVQDLKEIWLDQNRLQAGDRPGSGSLALSIQPRGPVELPHFEIELAGGQIELQGKDQGSVQIFNIKGNMKPFVPREHRGVAWLRFLTAEVRVGAEAWGIDTGLDATSLLLRDLPVSVGGSGRLDTHISVDKGKLQPDSRLELEGDDVRLDYLNYHGSGDGRLAMTVDEVAHLELRLNDFTVGAKGEKPYIEGQGLLLEASSPSLDLVEPDPQARAKVTLPRSKIPDFSVYDAYLPAQSPIRLVSGQGQAEAELHFEIAAGKPASLDGQVRILGDVQNATYEDGSLEGKVDLRTSFSGVLGKDLQQQKVRLSNASLTLDDVRVKGPDPKEPWWARVEIPEGQATFARPLSVSADITATVADSRPLIAIAMKRKKMPKWVENLLTLHPLTVTSALQVDESHAYLRGLILLGGRHLETLADLKLAHKAYMGLVLVKWRRLSMAVELGPAPDQRKIDLIGAKRFYEKRLPYWQQELGAAPN